MTRERFIEELEERGYPYREKGNKIVVTHKKGIELELLELPPGVEFRNSGAVYLDSLKTIPPDTIFGDTTWNVYLRSLKTLPLGVVFKNGGNVYLGALITLPPGVEFGNRGSVYLPGIRFNDWDGNIEGIAPNRLLNKMIADGLFDRR